MKIKWLKILVCLLTISIISSCGSRKPYYAKSEIRWQTANTPDSLHLKYSIFLIGDVGKPDDKRQEPALKLLQQQIYYKDSLAAADTSATKSSSLNSSHKEDAVIFLGDNIYETGLPKPDAPDRKEKERRIIAQMDVVKNFKGQTIFIPGNHDWNEMRPGGLEAVNREEAFVENYLDSANVFLPDNGCAGPIELHPHEDLVIIVLDSQWWLEKYKKPVAPENGCTSGSKVDIIEQVKDILIRNRGKNIVLAEHHPLFSNGVHGGYFTLKDYIFPLTLVRDNLYIPLPIIGSIYPLLRQYGISRQDLSNKDYQQLKRGLLAILEDEKNVVMVAGHEHALQFNKYKDLNHIISGGGSKSTRLSHGNNALFTYSEKGFSRLNYYDNGQCWVEFWVPEGDGKKGKMVYRSPLYSIPKAQSVVAQNPNLVSYKDSTRVMPAGQEYDARKLKRQLLGQHYRDDWATPIKVKYLDMATFGGGLTPIKMGGGHQTTSIQLKGKDGNIYQFRTINKDPSTLLPIGFEKTFAEDLFQDQISTAHPYGALIVPDLAQAIGVYHTNPQIFYMPYSPLLGPYLQQIGGKLGLIEIRPDDDVSSIASFGNAKDAVSTNTLYEKLKDDNDNSVDQPMFLKARLLDILIGDWDRHEDQWRWAEFKKQKGKLYRPIPRDRDQAFAKYDGLLPGLISKLIPDLQSFKSTIPEPAKLSIAARNLDRNLLNELSEKDWQKTAEQMKKALSDQVLTKAVHKLPAEVYAKSGDEILEKLKSRRDGLIKTAETYYKILAQRVNVTGTDKKEFFHIKLSPDSTSVSVYKISKQDKVDQRIYHRKFANKETEEINLYAFGGKDSILFDGDAGSHPIKIRVIGGDGKDNIADKSDKGRIIVYDTKADNNVTAGTNTRVRLSDNENVNDYNPNEFLYDRSGKVPSLDYNADDGLFFGFGFSQKHYGFRKEPYSYAHKIVGNYAPKNNSFNIKFTGEYNSIFGKNNDLLVGAMYYGPQFTFNYFGEGNTTTYKKEELDNYRVRSRNLITTTFFQHRFTKAFAMGIGPGYEYYNILPLPNRYVSQPGFPFNDEIGKPFRYVTVRSFANINFVDDDRFPTSGVRWKNEFNYFKGFNLSKSQHVQLKSDFSFYATPNFNFPITYAIKIGGATNIGDYQFFQGNSLASSKTLTPFGTWTNLRGYRDNRFTGRSYLYQNSDIRLTVTSFRNYLLAGNFGVIGFFDTGKVFVNGDEKSKWHNGYGPGLWMNFFNKLLISGGYGFSKDGQSITVKSGMFF